MTHPSGYISAHNISAPKGCCALKFLSALEIDQALIAHTQSGTGVPQKINRENVKFGLKVQRLSLYNFHASRNILTKLLQET